MKKWLLLFAVLQINSLLGVAQASAEQSSASKKPPNILFILTDDQRFDTIHALGNKDIKTPNLDKLATSGFVFHNAYCQGSMVGAVCAPSRTMIMTGKSLFRIPAPNAKQYDGPTLGGVFRAAGYATLFVGKRGNSFLVGNQAFETVIYHDDKGEKRAFSSKFMADQSISWLNKHKGNKQPFFIYLGPPVPHDPRIAPPEYMKMYDPAKIPLPPNFMPMHPFDNGDLKIRDELLAPFPRTPDVMKRHIADYYATITYMDFQIGRIIAALQELGELENTIIVFSSDQGLAVGGRHGLMGKQNLYEEFKSPLIFAGLGIPKGQSQALVYLFDIFPTLCDTAKLPIPKACEGSSLLPVMKGDKKGFRNALFAAYKDCQRMVRNDRWKIIWYPKIDRYQLFDLKNDPWEINDLQAKAEHAPKLAELKKLLAAQQEMFGDNKAPRPALTKAKSSLKGA